MRIVIKEKNRSKMWWRGWERGREGERERGENMSIRYPGGLLSRLETFKV